VTDSEPDPVVFVNSGGRRDVPEQLLRAAVLHGLADAGCEAAEVSVTMLSDAEIREMNRSYLSRDAATDVIAFSLGDHDRTIGDVYIGYGQAVRQASLACVSVDEELARLAIHGVLHVLGHDHPAGEERWESPMFRIQERLLREVLTDR